jgi:hypothetical protein
MNNLEIDHLITQVSELKLRKRTEYRTIHWSDVKENKNLREGDVIPMISWVNDDGVQWTKADIMYYIKLCNAFDTPTEQLLSERKTVQMELIH